MEEAWTAIVLRLIVAFVLSSVIAFERQMARRVVPFGTYVLVCTGACLFVLVQIQTHYAGLDLSLASGLAAGVGFLGSGVIAQRGGAQAFTTATTIWLMAALGATIGAAMYQTAGAAFGMVLFVLGLDRLLEKRGAGSYFRVMQIGLAGDRAVKELERALDAYHGRVTLIEWRDDPAAWKIEARVSVTTGAEEAAVNTVRALPGVTSVRLD